MFEIHTLFFANSNHGSIFQKKCPIKVGINKYNINSQYEDRTESEKENIRKGDFSR